VRDAVLDEGIIDQGRQGAWDAGNAAEERLGFASWSSVRKVVARRMPEASWMALISRGRLFGGGLFAGF
jgi:hypothetical protein